MPQLNFSREHDDHNIEQIDQEIDAWIKVFTNGMIMRCHYETEKELEEDWYKYMSQSYEHKCIANNMAYRFYGLKNEEIYHKFKRYFITHDIIQDKQDAILTYTPKKLLNEGTTYRDKEAEDVYNTTGYYVITNNNQSSQDLIDQLQRFRSMAHDKKVKADTYSIKIYGKTNEERYTDMIPKLLSQEPVEDEDDDFSDDIPYRPQQYYSEQFSNINAYEKTREIVDDNSTSITEAILITENICNIEPTSVLEDTIRDNLVDHLYEKINRSRDEYYLGFKTPYFLPHEIIKLTAGKPLFKDKFATDWLVDYQSKLLGAKPRKPINSLEWKYEVTKAIEKDDTDRIIRLGWNPSIPFNEDTLIAAGKRTNSILKNNIGYDFVDLSEMTMRMSINEDEDIQSKQGIYIVFNKDNLVQSDIPRVLISTNPTLKNLYAVTKHPQYHYGLVKYMGDIKRQIKDINVYALMLPEEYSQDDLEKPINSLLTTNPNAKYLNYSNEKMFCITAMNEILYIVSTVDQNGVYRNTVHAPSYANLRAQGKDYIYKVYSGKSSSYYPSQVNNTLNHEPLSSIEEDSDLFPYISVVPLRSPNTSVSPELYNDANAFLAEYQKRPIDYTTANALINDQQLQNLSILNYGQIQNKLLKMIFVKSQLDTPFGGLDNCISNLVNFLRNRTIFDPEEAYRESPYNRMVIRIIKAN